VRAEDEVGEVERHDVCTQHFLDVVDNRQGEYEWKTTTGERGGKLNRRRFAV